jgi:transposase
MLHSSSATLFSDPEIDTKAARTYVNACLWFDDREGYRVVFCRQEPLYRVALSDPKFLATICVMLRQSALATQQEIASAFGHSVATQRRWETRFQRDGDVGLHGKKSTGRKPKLDPSQAAFVKHWFAQGLSNSEMARRLAVNEATIRRVLRQMGLQRRISAAAELPLGNADVTSAEPVVTPSVTSAETAPLEPVVTAAPELIAVMATTLSVIVAVTGPEEEVLESTSASPGPTVTATSASQSPVPTVSPPVGHVPVSVLTIDRDPDDRAGDRLLARQGLLDDAAPLFGDHEELPRAGVLLALPMLLSHGGLEVFGQLFGSIGPAFYGLRTTVLTLFFLALLRIKRPENLKEHAPAALGKLLGLDRIAEVKTLRRKLTLLAERGQGRELMSELARLRLAQDEDRLAFLYLDGHVREYSGKEPLAKAKKAQRAVATCAATDTWLHDADGAPLLVVTSEMNAGLTQVIEAIVTNAKSLVPAGQRLTVLFDRGGWSLKLFARLHAMGVDIITYRKGKCKPIPQSRFTEHRTTEEGHEKTYWLYDQPCVRVGRLRPHRRRGGVGPEYLWLRQVTVLRDDGRQTVIVTNRSNLSALQVVVAMFRRWRQENYFKYMDAEFALDALVEYGVDDVPSEATRPNPERKKLAKERQEAKAEVMRLRAELGVEANANEERRRPTMRGFKVAQADLRERLQQAESKQRGLAEQLAQLPKRVPAKGLKTLKTEKKLIVDALKMIAYHCETMLLERLSKHYARADDEGRTLLHAVFQSSARMEVTETELKIWIAAQSSPHRTEAVAKVCQELDAEVVYFPGSNLRLRLAVATQ